VEELEKFCADLRVSTPSRRPSLLSRIGPYIRGRSSTSSSKSSVGSGDAVATGAAATAAPASKKSNPFADLSLEQLRMVLAIDKRAKQLETALMSRTTEMEDLRARNNTLTHTKQVLVDTIAGKDNEIQQLVELCDQARAQTQSDREIISYLDTRSQELELVAEDGKAQAKAKDAQLMRQEEDIKALRARVEELEGRLKSFAKSHSENRASNYRSSSPLDPVAFNPKEQGILQSPPPQNEAPVM